MIARLIKYLRELPCRMFSKFRKPKKEIPVINMANFKILDFDSIVLAQPHDNEQLPRLGRIRLEIPMKITFFKMPNLKKSNRRYRAKLKARKLIKRGHDNYVKQAFSL